MSDLTDLLDSLDAAREAARPGPWEQPPGSRLVGDRDGLYVAITGTSADGAWIVAATDATPRLTAALRAVEALADEGGHEGWISARKIEAALTAALTPTKAAS